MREQFKGIRESDVEACIPADVLGQIETEADRLTDVLAGLISYSDEIRMEDGEGSRRSLQTIESDAEALALFRHQLEADPVSGFLNGTKVRQGKSADTLLGSFRKKNASEDFRTDASNNRDQDCGQASGGSAA